MELVGITCLESHQKRSCTTHIIRRRGVATVGACIVEILRPHRRELSKRYTRDESRDRTDTQGIGRKVLSDIGRTDSDEDFIDRADLRDRCTYSPECIRRDEEIVRAIRIGRRLERMTEGCRIRRARDLIGIDRSIRDTCIIREYLTRYME